MKAEDVKDYYKTLYQFRKATGMSCSSLANWLKWGFIPFESQMKLEHLTEGKLKALWTDGKPK